MEKMIQNSNSRTYKSIRNILVGIILQAFNTILSFVVRTSLIKTVGLSAVSLNGLFNEVIAMLSMAELGIGSAIIYNLYKPLAEKNYNRVNSLMKLFKKAYIIIAIVTFIIGIMVLPFIQYLISDFTYELSYLRLIYMLFVIQTATSYLFSYKISLLNADQKTYIYSEVSIAVKLIGTILQIILLYFTKNYIIYLIMGIGINLLINILCSKYVNKEYPFLREKSEKISKTDTKEIFSNIKNIFIKTLSGRITNSTDNILISTLVGTFNVGYYSNYTMIYTVFRLFCNQLSSGMSGAIGNVMVTEESDSAEKILKRLTFIFYFFGSILIISTYVSIQTFIRWWLGKEFLLSNTIVFLTCFLIFIEFLKTPLWQFLEVSGLFAKDRNISILGSIVNIIVSIILGLKLGMSGIFIGTICTYVIQLFLKSKLLFEEKFHKHSNRMWIIFCNYSIIMIIQMLLVNNILIKVVIYNDLLVKFVIQVILAGILSLLINILIFHKTEEFLYLKTLVFKIIKSTV